MCLEVSGPEAGRRYVDVAHADHPSLIDSAHVMDALFGVVNIPNSVWIDEAGMIVRPAEPAYSGMPTAPMRIELPAAVNARMAGRGRPALNVGTNRDRYAHALRDWVAKGAASQFAMSPFEVVERSQPRGKEVSEAAAHFELGQHLWRAGDHDSACRHFNEAHRRQPDNWTYKRQAYSLVTAARHDSDFARFIQMPLSDDEPWPFDSDFWSSVEALGGAEYYPTTL